MECGLQVPYKKVMILHWKISDFVEKIKQTLQENKLHINTVDGWFKKLEEEQIHYIIRTEDTNEKVYDELDLQIALFIKKKRNEKWSLGAIFNEIKSEFELRPSPVEFNGTTNVPQMIDIETLKTRLIRELKGTFEEVAATQLIELKGQYEEILKQLPNPKSKEMEKEERFQEMVAKRRVESQLEEEALNIWSTKPENERLKKVGWFRKEEDLVARNQFVRNYTNEHFASKLKKELGIEGNS